MSEQVSSPSSEQAASPKTAPASPTAETSTPKVQRYATEADVLALMTNDKFKKFCKKKCGECGCVAFKRFAKMSPLVVRARVGSLWCQKCGRLLCEAHRNQHSCEMEMEELERRRRVDVGAGVGVGSGVGDSSACRSNQLNTIRPMLSIERHGSDATHH